MLLVDDDANVLAGYVRLLHRTFSLVTAESGLMGLDMLSRSGPFAVVVADMHMPIMDGIQFLMRVRSDSPHTVRMMLTGYTEQRIAVDAVNEGQIFRFLTKPCPADELASALREGIEHYRLVIAEQELLSKTLSGSIKVLVEILELANPIAFSRAMRLRRYVKHMASVLDPNHLWQYELAAMLSQIGCVTLPAEVIERAYSGGVLLTSRDRGDLTEAEWKAFSAHPTVAAGLLAHVPRLEKIAMMIETQMQPLEKPRAITASPQDRLVIMGSQMLHIALAYDREIAHGVSHHAAIVRLQEQSREFDTQIVTVLAGMTPDVTEQQAAVRLMYVREITSGMIPEEDIRTQNGGLLLAQGRPVTPLVLRRLQNFSGIAGIQEPIRMRTASAAAEQS